MDTIQLTKQETEALRKLKAEVETELQDAARKLQDEYQQRFQHRMKGALAVILASRQLDGQYIVSEDLECLIKAG